MDLNHSFICVKLEIRMLTKVLATVSLGASAALITAKYKWHGRDNKPKCIQPKEYTAYKTNM